MTKNSTDVKTRYNLQADANAMAEIVGKVPIGVIKKVVRKMLKRDAVR